MKDATLIKQLVDELLEEQLGRFELKNRFDALGSFLYKIQKEYAEDARHYDFKYDKGLDGCTVKVTDVLAIMGKPNSLEAELIFKDTKPDAEGGSE